MGNVFSDLEVGSLGPQGPVGPIGHTGPPGSPGAHGDSGKSGIDAFCKWVPNLASRLIFTY